MFQSTQRVVIVGRAFAAGDVAAALRQIGAAGISICSAGELSEALKPAEPAAVLVLALGSLAELEAVERVLASLPRAHRPICLALLSEHTVEQFQPSPVVDDLLVWPCSVAELKARLSVAVWRRLGLTGQGVLRSGPLAVDTVQHRVVVEGREVHLTVREYKLLLALLRAKGAVLSRQELLERVWGADYLGGARTVDIHIRRLRAKMPEIASRIITVWGFGYRLAADDAE